MAGALRSPYPHSAGLGGVNQAVLVAQSIGAILGEKQRPVEIDHPSPLRHEDRRRHRERRGDHAAGHDGEAEPFRFGCHRQRFGQSAGLVELDIDRVVAAHQRGEACAVMHAFVGADRDRPLHR